MALSWGPNDAVANSQLALSYYYLRDYTEAKKYFKRVLDLDPAYECSPQLFLAHIAIAEQANDEARAYLRGFLENHPNAPNAPEVRATLEHLPQGTIINERSIRK
jgi:tetratricopeptide (TPR) repeat protein